MERGCILPDNLREKLHNNSALLASITQFCACTSDELFDVLQKRDIGDEHLSYGYKKFSKKKGNKIRIMREPYPILKKIQKVIKERIEMLPISLCATGGKHGDSPEKNVNLHRKNPYLITLDIKNAYPSIDTHRVYKNLEGTMYRLLKYRCPLLKTDEEKNIFIRTITHLCVSENELPQGAPTSTQIQNIVMAEFDRKIQKNLAKMPLSDSVYSRYADDIAISFTHFSTMTPLQKKMEAYIEKLIKADNLEAIHLFIDEFSKDTFVITDAMEFSYLQEKMERIRFLLSRSFLFLGGAIEMSDEEYKAIGTINTFKHRIIYSNQRIDDIKDEIIKTMASERRKVNFIKSETWTPQSNRDKEINGIVFDSDGNRKLSTKRKEEYIKIFTDLAKFTINDLFDNDFYRKKFKVEHDSQGCIPTIIKTLDGYYHRIQQVYGKGKEPKKLTIAYNKAIKKWKNPQKIIDLKSNVGSNEEHISDNSIIKGDTGDGVYFDEIPFP